MPRWWSPSPEGLFHRCAGPAAARSQRSKGAKSLPGTAAPTLDMCALNEEGPPLGSPITGRNRRRLRRRAPRGSSQAGEAAVGLVVLERLPLGFMAPDFLAVMLSPQVEQSQEQKSGEGTEAVRHHEIHWRPPVVLHGRLPPKF
jgi:hypothetical protein